MYGATYMYSVVLYDKIFLPKTIVKASMCTCNLFVSCFKRIIIALQYASLKELATSELLTRSIKYDEIKEGCLM